MCQVSSFTVISQEPMDLSRQFRLLGDTPVLRTEVDLDARIQIQNELSFSYRRHLNSEQVRAGPGTSRWQRNLANHALEQDLEESFAEPQKTFLKVTGWLQPAREQRNTDDEDAGHSWPMWAARASFMVSKPSLLEPGNDVSSSCCLSAFYSYIKKTNKH